MVFSEGPSKEAVYYDKEWGTGVLSILGSPQDGVEEAQTLTEPLTL
jgi:hypothetical protein